MKLSLSGLGFLFGYIVMVGVASFLEKFSMKVEPLSSSEEVNR